MLAMYAVRQGLIPSRVIPKIWKNEWHILFPCLALRTLGKSMGVKHTLLAQLCGQEADQTEMGATLFIKNGDGRNFLTSVDCLILPYC